ncbi:MAG: hypothetical protein JWQ71_1523 [Pedosphaera sp.]|nr:hypothetical protein [Pedosphaera sp.]
MNSRSKLILRGLLLLILAAGAVMIVANQKAISQAKQENQILINEKAEAQRLLAENKEIPRLREELQGIEKLQQENKDLPKLRNEVRQLHRETEELEKLRNENQRLLAQQKVGSVAPVPAALPEGYIAKAFLVDAGLSSPEATVQTFFCAMRQGNVKRFFQCMNDEHAKQVKTEEEEQMRQDMLKKMKNFPGYAIAEKSVLAEDEVEVGVKSSSEGESMKFRLKKIKGEWKIKN